MLKVNDEVEEVLVRVISIACPILSILGYFTGISVVKEIRQKGCTRKFRFLPNLTGIIYCLVWFYYGLLKLDWTVMFSNTIGSSMQCFYMMVFIGLKLKIFYLKSIFHFSFFFSTFSPLFSTASPHLYCKYL